MSDGTLLEEIGTRERDRKLRRGAQHALNAAREERTRALLLDDGRGRGER